MRTWPVFAETVTYIIPFCIHNSSKDYDVCSSFFDVSPHMCTFTGCFALCLSSLGLRCLRKHKRLWCSSWMVVSSVKITSLKSLLALNRSLHWINLFLLSYRKVNVTCIIHMSINLCNLHQESAGSNVALCTPTLILMNLFDCGQRYLKGGPLLG